MKSTLVVVADLACLKAYKLEETQVTRTPRLELVDHYENADAHGKLVDKVTDLSGRFPRGGTAGAMSDGERHNIQLEMRKRLGRQLAHRLNNLARDNGIERCLVAFSRKSTGNSSKSWTRACGRRLREISRPISRSSTRQNFCDISRLPLPEEATPQPYRI
jgi:hypothetical protein